MQLTGANALFGFAPTVAGPRPVDVAASERRIERRSEAAARSAELAGVLTQTGDLRNRLRTVEALVDTASLYHSGAGLIPARFRQRRSRQADCARPGFTIFFRRPLARLN